MPTRALELFAGIGGGSLALKASGIRTVAYCEIDPWCQTVLLMNMAKGRLDRAPIHPDVTTLSGKDLPRIGMVAGGFPCLGLSSVGKRKGLYGDSRSALVKQVYRLVDETRPKYVFLENTPRVVADRDYPRLLSEFTDRGYQCAFMVCSASQVGAKHQRMRWFLLAKHNNAPGLKLNASAATKLSRYFDQHVSEKLTERHHGTAVLVCKSFGNCVVPAQAAVALHTLNTILSNPAGADLRRTKLQSIDRLLPTLVLSPREMYQDASYQVPSTECSGETLTIDPPRGGSPETERIVKGFSKKCFPTPRTGPVCATPGASLTVRQWEMQAPSCSVLAKCTGARCQSTQRALA